MSVRLPPCTKPFFSICEFEGDFMTILHFNIKCCHTIFAKGKRKNKKIKHQQC